MFGYKLIPIMDTISKQKVIEILVQKNTSLLDISTTQKFSPLRGKINIFHKSR